MAEKPGGHKIEFVQKLDDRLKCQMCKLVLRVPFQTSCGHRYCESCIKDVIDRGDKKCPEDHEVLSHEQIFRDQFCNREILDLECYCTNKEFGCDWQGPLKSIEEHYNDCLFLEVTCPNEGCGVKMLRQMLEKHKKEECKFKKAACLYCGIELPEPMIKEHFNTECTKYPLDCQKGCGKKVARSEMEQHLAKYCARSEATCPMVGQCNFTGSRDELRKHFSGKQVEHAEMVIAKMTTLNTNIERVEGIAMTTKEQQENNNDQIGNHRDELARIRDDLAALRAAVEQRNRSHEEPEIAQPIPKREPQGAEKPSEMDEIKARLTKLEEQVKQLIMRDRKALGRGQIGGQISDSANEAVPDLERRVAALEHINTLSDVQMADHDVKIAMLETTSYDGEFYWKIDDITRRMQDAVAGKCLSLYSPQFYVKRYGYKVCARVYLNGDGMGKGTHLSLFFVVMRGGYDSLLPWPFQQKVTFKLIDQTGDQHIVDSFRPDPNSSSFQKPTSNMNIASGCPLFVPKSVLQSRGYIKDETIFFKITVDTSGLTI